LVYLVGLNPKKLDIKLQKREIGPLSLLLADALERKKKRGPRRRRRRRGARTAAAARSKSCGGGVVSYSIFGHRNESIMNEFDQSNHVACYLKSENGQLFERTMVGRHCKI
jgi:hypothetical protein